MKKNCRHTINILCAALLLAAAALCGVSAYLLNYALKPGDRSRHEDVAWSEMSKAYPGLLAWRDSLVRTGAWRDTTIQATDGTPLHAYFVRSGRATPRTALLLHGYTDCAVRMMHLGRMYLDSIGANILVPDLRNAGRSGGDHFQMGWYDRLDAKRWAALIPQLFGDSATAVVHGISMGAATAMMLSGETDVTPAVKAYVEDCGYTSVNEQFTKELDERFGLPRWPFIPLASALCKVRYGWSFGEASALRQVARCQRPMLFIHGTDDTFVPTSMARPLYEAHAGAKELWLVSGAAHARSYQSQPAEYRSRVTTFLHAFAGW